MPYQIHKSDGSTLATVADNSVVTDACSITLLGMGSIYYGTEMAEDLVHMLEHFASAISPNNPIIGQLWFDISEVPSLLRIYDGTGWAVLASQLGPGGMIPNGTTYAGNTSNTIRTSGCASVALLNGPRQTSVVVILAEGKIVATISPETIVSPIVLPLTLLIEGTQYAFSTRFPNGLNAGQTLATDLAHYVFGGVLQTPPNFVPTIGNHGTDKNYVDGVRSALQAEIDALTAHLATANQYIVPTGGIIMWNGSAVPTGWGLCDGSTYTLLDGTGTIVSPNLVDKFIVGTGGAYTLGETGGAVHHNHVATVNDHVLAVSELPQHNHTLADPPHNHPLTVVDNGHVHNSANKGFMEPDVPGHGIYSSLDKLEDWNWNPSTALANADIRSTITPVPTGVTVNVSIGPNTPGGNGHNHEAETANTDGRPPFYSLAYIIKK